MKVSVNVINKNYQSIQKFDKQDKLICLMVVFIDFIH